MNSFLSRTSAKINALDYVERIGRNVERIEIQFDAILHEIGNIHGIELDCLGEDVEDDINTWVFETNDYLGRIKDILEKQEKI